MIKKEMKKILFTVFLCLILTGCQNKEDISVNSISTETNHVVSENNTEISVQESEGIKKKLNDYIGQQLDQYSFYQENTIRFAQVPNVNKY